MKIKKKYPKYLWLLLVLIILNVGFIWIHSMMPRSDSLQESNFFSELIRPIVVFVFGDDKLLVRITRKAAHFLEYFSLGLWTSLFVILKSKFINGINFRKKNMLICIGGSAIFGLLAASIDETIQIFSLRGPLVTDVLLDFFAFCLALLIISLILLFKFFKKS